MIIGLDFDNTITLDEKCWLKVIKTFQTEGHEIIIVTARSDIEERRIDINKFVEKIGNVRTIFTNHLSKKDCCRKLGIKIDVWIDDKPEAVIFDREIRHQIWTEGIS